MTARSTAAVLATGLLLAACGGDDPGPTPSATASAVVDPTGTPSDAATATASPGASETTTQAPTESPPDPTSSPTSQPNPNPEGVDPEPIPTGTYSYATDGWSQLGNGTKEPMPSTTTLSAASMSGGRQVVTRDLTDDEGYGQTIQRVMEYAKTGFFLHEVRTSAKVKLGLLGDVTDNRTFVASPAGALGAPDSEVGWENTFTMTGDGVTLTITARLVRFEDGTWTLLDESDGVPGIGSRGHELDYGLLAADVDGSVWLTPIILGSLECRGVTDYDVGSSRSFLREHCIYAMDVAPDGSLWVQAYRDPADEGTTGTVETYVIRPSGGTEG